MEEETTKMKQQNNKEIIEKEIIETAKELGIGVYMVEEFITNPRILKFREVALKFKEKEMLDKIEKMIDEEIVVCDICKKYPENNCRYPCCKIHKKLKERLQKLKGDSNEMS